MELQGDRVDIGDSSQCDYNAMTLPFSSPLRIPRPVKLFIYLLSLLPLMLQTTSALWGQSAKTTRDTTELIALARKAIERNAATLQSVTARGNIRHLRFERDVETPTATLDADLALTYQAPKFRLTLQYAAPEERLATDSQRPTVAWRPAEGEGSSELKLQQQTILFDGKTVITVEQSRKGTWRGDIYFDFHKQNMLRMAGFPFEDPVALWNEPLRIDRADLVDSETTPLSGGGFLGVLNKDTYRLKYYFLGGFDHDLRRVSSYRLGEEIPFRDWHLIWQPLGGGHYVERLVRRINESTGAVVEANSSGVTHELVELHYKNFKLDPRIESNAFDLTGLSLPDAVPFYDHRVNVNGKPKLMKLSGGSLVAFDD